VPRRFPSEDDLTEEELEAALEKSD